LSVTKKRDIRREVFRIYENCKFSTSENIKPKQALKSNFTSKYTGIKYTNKIP
jgi:hypothetical protein